MSRFFRFLIAGPLVVFGVRLQAQSAESGLLAEIGRIAAIDQHSHADAVSAGRRDKWDLARPLGAPSYPAVVRLRVDNPEWSRAWKALYGYGFSDTAPEHTRPLLETKLRLMQEKGTAWPAWVLDRAGVEIAFVNADTLGPGLPEPRFRWVPFGDPLLSPFDKRRDRLETLMTAVSVKSLAPTLREFAATTVIPTLERWKSSRAVAVKFIAAYRRPLDFEAVTESHAEEIYLRCVAGSEAASDLKAIQDYLFRLIARECGRLGLVVHIHTGNGNGPYFNNTGASPALLESVFDDRTLRATKFVMIHGGWPFEKLAGAMLDKPGIYADFSAQTFYLSRHALSEILRGWLEWQPEKVLFGSDAYSDPNTPLADWEEKTWLTTTVAREALATALEAMMRDGQITRDRALEIARLVLRENARRLYGL
jgi:uncharacterized protein